MPLAREQKQEIITGYANEGTLETDGVDFRANTDFDFGGAGRLQNRLTVSYVNKYDVTSGAGTTVEWAGRLGYPDLRANLANDWSFGDWSFTWNINYIGGQEEPNSTTQQVGGYAGQRVVGQGAGGVAGVAAHGVVEVVLAYAQTLGVGPHGGLLDGLAGEQRGQVFFEQGQEGIGEALTGAGRGGQGVAVAGGGPQQQHRELGAQQRG